MAAAVLAAGAQAQTPPATTAPAADQQISRELARELKQYSKQKRNGEIMYCKADAETGTRVPKKKCYTIDAVKQMLAESQRARDEIQKPAAAFCGASGCG
jgi:hypothetical protein